ncbi:MAG TPA: hypothetical protein VFQ53_41775 [Kofleriaceae bacterium]|nr:hypothetical protein [Kofleriaceae bacterium]
MIKRRFYKTNETLHTSRREFSLLIAEPTAELLEKLTTEARRKNLVFPLYAPSDRVALVIPAVDDFTEYGSLGAFIESLKPALLDECILRVGMNRADIDAGLLADFDSCVNLQVIDEITLLSDFAEFRERFGFAVQ